MNNQRRTIPLRPNLRLSAKAEVSYRRQGTTRPRASRSAGLALFSSLRVLGVLGGKELRVTLCPRENRRPIHRVMLPRVAANVGFAQLGW